MAGRAFCTSSIASLSYLFGPVADEQHDDCGKTDNKGGRSRPSNFVVTPVSRLGRVSCALIAMPEVLERLITYSGEGSARAAS